MITTSLPGSPELFPGGPAGDDPEVSRMMGEGCPNDLSGGESEVSASVDLGRVPKGFHIPGAEPEEEGSSGLDEDDPTSPDQAA